MQYAYAIWLKMSWRYESIITEAQRRCKEIRIEMLGEPSQRTTSAVTWSRIHSGWYKQKMTSKMKKKTFPDLRMFHHFSGKTKEQRNTYSHILTNVSISNDKRRLQPYKQKTSYSCRTETWGQWDKSKDMKDE